jgi:hypothetical protein
MKQWKVKPVAGAVALAVAAGVVAMAGPVGAASVTLVNGSGSSCTYSTMNTDASGNVTVNCDAGGGGTTILFSPSSVSVTEGGTATITIVRSGDASGANAVTITRTGGTAASGTDYPAFTSSTVSFAASETSKTVQLATTDDAETESTETVIFTLSNPTNGATLGTATATVSIADNDAGGGGGGACGALPQGTIQQPVPSFFNSPGLAFDTPTITAGSAYAYQFIVDSQIFPNGVVLDLAANTSTGGQNGKEVVVSTCPGDFTPAYNACRRVLSGGVTTIYMKEAAYCRVPPGQTYYINIRPNSSSPASVKMSTSRL